MRQNPIRNTAGLGDLSGGRRDLVISNVRTNEGHIERMLWVDNRERFKMEPEEVAVIQDDNAFEQGKISGEAVKQSIKPTTE